MDFGASASSGSVDAEARFDLSATYAEIVDLAESVSTRIDLGLSNLSFGFDTLLGAAATAGVDFNNISIPLPFPLGDINVNPPRFAVIDEDYTLKTEKSGSSLGTTLSDTGNTPVAGVGPSSGFGVVFETRLTLDASQISTFQLDKVEGLVQATHSSGETRQGAFDIFASTVAVDLDLSLPGEWDLDLVGVRLRNRFDTSLGLAASGRVGFGALSGCGDLTKDSDNGALCFFDTGSVFTSEQLTLSDPAAFEIAWGVRAADIGGLTVRAPQVVPLPASLPLLAAGLGGLALWRRRAA